MKILPISIIFVLYLILLKSRDTSSTCDNICYKDVLKAVKNHTCIIDVRSKQEVAESGLIPNSINIPLACLRSKMQLSKRDFKSEFKRSRPKVYDMIIVTGRSSYPNTDACSILYQCGYCKTFDFIGGYDEWSLNNPIPCDEMTTPKPCEDNCDDICTPPPCCD